MNKQELIPHTSGELDLRDECFQYLDNLRESGMTNMFGAGQYLMRDMGLESKEAGKITVAWMDTFDEGKPAYERALQSFTAEQTQ